MPKLTEIVCQAPEYNLNGFQPALLENQGKQGQTFRVSGGHVAKFGNMRVYDDNFFYNYLLHEREVMRTLYESGISVPKPEGIFRIQIKIPGKKVWKVQIKKDLVLDDLGLVMEYIPGVPINLIDDYEMLQRARELMFAEYDRAGDVTDGCDLFGADDRNAIYQPEKDKVVLIDFLDWIVTGHKCLGCPEIVLNRKDIEWLADEQGLEVSKTL